MGRTLWMLRWQYLGRLMVAAAIFIAAVSATVQQSTFVNLQVDNLIAGTILVSAMLVTLFGIWWTYVLRRNPGHNFLYAQILYDVCLATAVVHVTGGANSQFAPLYILVIALAALLLPLPGGMLIGALSSLMYFVDLVFLHHTAPSWTMMLQVALMVLMAIVTA